MFNYDFSFEEFVLVAQSLLTRIDFLRSYCLLWMMVQLLSILILRNFVLSRFFMIN